MTSDAACRALLVIAVIALIVGLLGSLGLVLFRGFFSRFPAWWG